MSLYHGFRFPDAGSQPVHEIKGFICLIGKINSVPTHADNAVRPLVAGLKKTLPSLGLRVATIGDTDFTRDRPAAIQRLTAIAFGDFQMGETAAAQVIDAVNPPARAFTGLFAEAGAVRHAQDPPTPISNWRVTLPEMDVRREDAAPARPRSARRSSARPPRPRPAASNSRQDPGPAPTTTGRSRSERHAGVGTTSTRATPIPGQYGKGSEPKRQENDQSKSRMLRTS